jgi:putative methionine-R-sulfoxide reductase with GAF domain
VRRTAVADQNGAGAEAVQRHRPRAIGVACDAASAQENVDPVRRTEKAFGPIDLFCTTQGSRPAAIHSRRRSTSGSASGT